MKTESWDPWAIEAEPTEDPFVGPGDVEDRASRAWGRFPGEQIWHLPICELVIDDIAFLEFVLAEELLPSALICRRCICLQGLLIERQVERWEGEAAGVA